MLSTSLSQDLYKTFVDPGADDARLLRVSRLTAAGAGVLGIALALVLPSVADALKAFYGIMTVALFVPLLWGLLGRAAGARVARAAVVGAALATGGALVALRGHAARAWLPYVAGMALSAAVFAGGSALDSRRRAP
jgi:SSS family solute:Na+ symporter